MKSYNVSDEKKEFPKIEMPLNAQELAWVAKACNLQIQERFVPKSARMEQLEHELKLASALQGTAKKLEEEWSKNTVMPDVRYKASDDYAHKDQSWRYVVQRNMNDTDALVKNYDKTIRTALGTINQTLDTAVRELQRSMEIEEKGNSGEDRVEKHLVNNLNCRILSGVVLPGAQVQDSDPKTAETDLLVFTQNGIYVCEIKNYGKAGQTLRVREDGHILKLDHNGVVLEDMGSPFAQNNRHCAAVEQAIRNAGLTGIPVFSAVIIANTDVNISNSTQHWIGDMYEFQDMVIIATSVEARLTQEQVTSAYAAVKNSRMTERKFPITAVSPVAGDLQIAFTHISNAMRENKRWAQDTENSVNVWVRSQQIVWQSAHKKECAYEGFMEYHDVASSISAFLAGLAVIIIGLVAFCDEIPPGIGWWAFAFTFVFLLIGRFWANRIRVCTGGRRLKARSALVAALLLLPRAVFSALLPTIILLIVCYIGS